MLSEPKRSSEKQSTELFVWDVLRRSRGCTLETDSRRQRAGDEVPAARKTSNYQCSQEGGGWDDSRLSRMRRDLDEEHSEESRHTAQRKTDDRNAKTTSERPRVSEMRSDPDPCSRMMLRIIISPVQSQAGDPDRDQSGSGDTQLEGTQYKHLRKEVTCRGSVATRFRHKGSEFQDRVPGRVNGHEQHCDE